MLARLLKSQSLRLKVSLMADGACVELPEAGSPVVAGAFASAQWVFSELLTRAEIEVDAALLFGLCGGAGLLESGSAQPPMTGWDPTQTSLQTGAAHLKITGITAETARAARAAEQLDGALTRDGSAIVWVDAATLRGTGVPPDGERCVPQAGTIAVVVQADGDGQHYAVQPAPNSVSLVDAKRLSEARSAAKRERNRLLTVRATEIDLARSVRGGLAMTAVGGTRAKKRDHGPSAADELAGQIASPGRSGWRRQFPDDQELIGQLEAFANQVEQEGGLYRDAQAAFEHLAAALLEIDALTEVAGRHALLASGWRAAAKQARALATKGSGELTPLAESITALAEDERETLELLRATLRSH